MENTIEYIKQQYEYFENEYWRVFYRAEKAKKEYVLAKSIHESYQGDLKRLDAERKQFETMYNEINNIKEK